MSRSVFVAIGGAVALAMTVFAPIGVHAQVVPSYARPGVPTYATREEQIHGRIAAFDGGYHLEVRDDRGFLDNVELHPGTVILPTGLRLVPGMIVSIDGYNAGPYFVANEIDTPYEAYGGAPYYPGYPYYSYGPPAYLGLVFGNPWWDEDEEGDEGDEGYHEEGFRGYPIVQRFEDPRGYGHGREWRGGEGDGGRGGRDAHGGHDGHDRG